MSSGINAGGVHSSARSARSWADVAAPTNAPCAWLAPASRSSTNSLALSHPEPIVLSPSGPCLIDRGRERLDVHWIRRRVRGELGGEPHASEGEAVDSRVSPDIVQPQSEALETNSGKNVERHRRRAGKR